MFVNCLAVGAGGFFGSVLRYLMGLIPVKETTVFPVRTFAVNLLGCLLIGVLAALAARTAALEERLLLFLKAGLCGGFTTFSTFALETTELMKSGHVRLAALYVILSAALGVGIIFGVDLLASK